MPKSSKRLSRIPGSYNEPKGQPLYGAGKKKLLKLPQYGGAIGHSSNNGWKAVRPLLGLPGQPMKYNL